MRKAVSRLIKGILGRHARAHASSIAFFFFMALIPLLILLASIVPFFGIEVEHVIRFFQEIFPDDSAQFSGGIIREAFDYSTAAFSFSALMLLWTASRGVSALIEGLNSVYDVEENRKFLKLTALSFGYTIALMAFLCTAIYFIFSGKTRSVLKEFFPQVQLQSATVTYFEFLALLLVGILFFCLVFKFLPSGKREILRQLPGAFIASAGWVVFSMGFRVYVNLFNSFTRFYGSLATVILLLFWFYWIFFILLTGGYVNAHLAQILPRRFVAFYYEKKALSLTVSGLFLLGFMVYLSDCYLNWRLYAFPTVRFLLILMRLVSMGSWLAAILISVKEMGMPFPRKTMLLLVLLMAGNTVFMRRDLIYNIWLYLLFYTFWNLVIILICVQILFREESSVSEPHKE